MKNPTILRRFATLPHVLAVLTVALALWVGQLPAWANSMPFSRIVVFGDSLSDDGKDGYGVYYWTGGAAPAPPYWNGRFSNGPVWAEYLARDLGMTGLLDDYAVGGATSGTQVNGGPPGWPHGVQSQIELYLSSHQGDPDALYIIWAGHNDIFIPLFQTPMGDLEAARIAFVQNMKGNIKALWAAGARHILVANVADIGKCPGFLAAGSGASAGASWLAASFNQSLAGALIELSAEGLPTIALDAFTVLDTVVANPAEFGFSNVIDQAILLYPADPSGYVFWDNVHPTTEAHKVIAQLAVRDLIDYFSPSRGKGQPPAQVNALNGLVQAGKGK